MDSEVLRSTSWSGPAPAPGDVVVDEGRLLVVKRVAQGPGIGQYRLDVADATVIVWTAQR